MKTTRRTIVKGLAGALMLPFLENAPLGAAAGGTPTRFLVVGNPVGMHPDHFFPKEFGKNAPLSHTLRSMEWLKDRMTILSHTDHNMVGGHGREMSFLSGVLPVDAQAFPEKNMSVDQVMARHTAAEVRYPSIGAGLDDGIRMSWTANGVENVPFTDPQNLFDHLFLNLTENEKKMRRQVIERNGSILDSVGDQFSSLKKSVSDTDRKRLDQFQTSIRDLEKSFSDRLIWIEHDKPKYDIAEHLSHSEVTIENRYNAIFDMISYAFETDLTRVATVAFPLSLSYTDVGAVNRSYHACTHNGKMDNVITELVAIESFQIAQLSRCLKKLDSIKEPNTDGTMLDHTMVLFGSGMGYGGTHSNRNLPIMVAGGGFKHLGHVDTSRNGASMPLCNLYVTLLNCFGIDRDKFNTSTGGFDLNHA